MTDAGSPGRRVLILSAPVGAGHDAAAAALAHELRAAGAVVEVIDGLALLGVERFVVDGYHFQILHAGWSWRLLYRATRSRLVIRLAGTLLALLACHRLLTRIRQTDPDVIVSAYPIVSAALAGLRRRARLPWPCATLVTDFDPHPGWIHPDLDANLTVGEPHMVGHRISPPVMPASVPPETRADIRAELGIGADVRVVLIVGGAWGVGSLHETARAAAATPGTYAITVTGHNRPLYEAMTSDRQLRHTTVLAYTRRMPRLMAASDVLIQNAGGLTCLEAFAAGLPVIMFDPLPGHGEDNAERMTQAGLTTIVRDAAGLQRLIASPAFWETLAPALARRSRNLFERPSAGIAVDSLTTKAIRQPRAIRRLAPITAVSLLLGGWFIAENPPRTDAAPRHVPVPSYQSHPGHPADAPTELLGGWVDRRQ